MAIIETNKKNFLEGENPILRAIDKFYFSQMFSSHLFLMGTLFHPSYIYL